MIIKNLLLNASLNKSLDRIKEFNKMHIERKIDYFVNDTILVDSEMELERCIPESDIYLMYLGVIDANIESISSEINYNNVMKRENCNKTLKEKYLNLSIDRIELIDLLICQSHIVTTFPAFSDDIECVPYDLYFEKMILDEHGKRKQILMKMHEAYTKGYEHGCEYDYDYVKKLFTEKTDAIKKIIKNKMKNL